MRENRSVNDFESLLDLAQALTTVAPLNPDGSRKDGHHYHEDEAPRNVFVDPALQAQHLKDVASHFSRSGNSLLEDDDDVEEAKHEERNMIGMEINVDNDPSHSAQVDPSSYDWVLENYDKATTVCQSLDDELKRLLVLKSYLILDSEREEIFEKITGLASRIMDCPIALVSLVDLGRQWFMSNRGLDHNVRETSRKTAFCAHAIMSKEDLLIVTDASKDFRFKENPLVTGPPDIRFYAGAPLLSPEGFKLGTLCVISNIARPQGLTLDEKQNMKELAAMTVDAMTRRRHDMYATSHKPAQVVAQIAHDLLTPLTGVQLSLSTLNEDDEFLKILSPQEKDLLSNASRCADTVEQICTTAISELRKHNEQNSHKSQGKKSNRSSIASSSSVGGDIDVNYHMIQTKELVNAMYVILKSFPKNVPVMITLDENVPSEIYIDELKIFRSALNFLSNACARTLTGSVELYIQKVVDQEGYHFLLFECSDTAPDIPVEQYPFLFRAVEYDSNIQCIRPKAGGGVEPVCQMQTTGLGLYSVAIQIAAVGGEYGFRPRNDGTLVTNGNEKSATGSVFWFKIPLVLNH